MPNKIWLVIKAINKNQSARDEFFRNPASYLTRNGIEFKDEEIMAEVVARVRKLQASPLHGYNVLPVDPMMLSVLNSVGDPDDPSPNPGTGNDDLLIN
jgi:hypothetical protein